MKDYYNILGVARTATDDEIKRAYRRLASQHHPDKGGDTAQFQAVQEAYSVLGDEAKRREYNNPRSSHVHMNFGPGAFDLDQIFNMFGANFRGQPQARVPRMTLWISLKDVAQGGPRTVAIQMGNQVSHVQIDIPQGISDGDSIRYPGLAPEGMDMVINYRVRAEPGWQRQGVDLLTETSVSLYDLILGGTVEIMDIRDRSLLLTIPPGTNPGTQLRMRGQGLPPSALPGQGQGRVGDLIVRVQARIPASYSPEFIDAVRRERGH